MIFIETNVLSSSTIFMFSLIALGTMSSIGHFSRVNSLL